MVRIDEKWLIRLFARRIHVIIVSTMMNPTIFDHKRTHEIERESGLTDSYTVATHQGACI